MLEPDPAARRVFFFESGRLGNQLFQYAVLRSLFPQARLELFGLDGLRRAVRTRGTAFHAGDRGWASRGGLLRRLLGVLAGLGLVGELLEQRDGADCRIRRRAGLLRGWWLVRPSYFQHPRFEPLIGVDFDLDAAAVADARRFLAEQDAGPGGRTPVFVHLRRGDYLTFPTPQAPAALTREWTLAALDTMRQAVGRPRWIVCSDDPAYARDLFAGEDAVFCARGELGDLAVMSVCEGGILSPSSYSWWAALLARRRQAARGGQGLFLAPRHWCGHRMGRWYPDGFVFEWITYRD